ncbi:MAG: sigma-70 family RNA polymerase sigma factor [Lachnospiraceae bacterium]|nr:sigma-70 family RNA polymerase sigma factor [Lachnospiraceae bacterium]
MSSVTKEVFEGLIKEYTGNMYRLALSILQNQYDAEDAVSESVLKAYKNLDRLQDADKFKSWILQITANEARMIYRKRKKHYYADNMEALMPSFEEDYHELWDVVMLLLRPYREVIILFYYERFSIAEIARILQVREGTVKSRLARGRRMLKEFLSRG